MIIEVIGTSVEDVIEAEKYGADRIELCQGMAEGGLTPSIGLVEAAAAAVDIPINVMVRPHSNSFIYEKSDLDIMCKDIKAIKRAGANGVVFGALTKEKKVDEESLRFLLDAAEGLEAVFHRAFDEVEDQFEALETIFKYKAIRTILTSGGKPKAQDAADQLAALVDKTKGSSLTIMPGSGLKAESIADLFNKVKPDALHFGTGVRKQNSFDYPIAKERIEEIRKITG